jgi:hypothetical protein
MNVRLTRLSLDFAWWLAWAGSDSELCCWVVIFAWRRG